MLIPCDNEAPYFSILIPFLRNWRGTTNLLSCLQSCLRQKSDKLVEILVIANQADPQLEIEIANIFHQSAIPIAVHVAHNTGVNFARNYGAHQAKGSLLLYLDDDCLLPHDSFLLELENLFRQNLSFSALGGAYFSAPKSNWKTLGYNALCKAWLEISMDPTHLGLPIAETKNLLGGNVCYRREVFHTTYFNENIISGADEAEFHSRLRKNGIRLGYAKQLQIQHNPDSSWRALFQRAWNQGRGRYLHDANAFFRKSSLRLFIRNLCMEKFLFPFALLHFPVLYFSQLANTPKFSKSIKYMCDEK